MKAGFNSKTQYGFFHSGSPLAPGQGGAEPGELAHKTREGLVGEEQL